MATVGYSIANCECGSLRRDSPPPRTRTPAASVVVFVEDRRSSATLGQRASVTLLRRWPLLTVGRQCGARSDLACTRRGERGTRSVFDRGPALLLRSRDQHAAINDVSEDRRGSGDADVEQVSRDSSRRSRVGRAQCCEVDSRAGRGWRSGAPVRAGRTGSGARSECQTHRCRGAQLRQRCSTGQSVLGGDYRSGEGHRAKDGNLRRTPGSPQRPFRTGFTKADSLG